MRGGLGGYALSRREIVPGGEPLDALDADVVEIAMCQLRRDRRALYRLMKTLYLSRRGTAEIAVLWRKTEYWVRRRQRDGLEYLLRNS